MRAGQYLYASCSAEYYGPILRVYKDCNGIDAMDIQIEDINDFIHHWWDDNNHPEFHAMQVEHNGPVIFRGLQFKFTELSTFEKERVECNTPPGGCYRCCMLFSVEDEVPDWASKNPGK